MAMLLRGAIMVAAGFDRGCQRRSQKDRRPNAARAFPMTELYKLHTPFVIAFLAFVVVFVVAHARR